MDDLPLLELFYRLREAGLPLGVDDYQLVLQALQAGFGLPNREALARLCRTIWVRSADEQRIFDYYFEQFIESETVIVSTNLEELLKDRGNAEEPKIKFIIYAIQIIFVIYGLALILPMGVSLLFVFSKNPPQKTALEPAKMPIASQTTVPSQEFLLTQNNNNNRSYWIIGSILLILSLGAGSVWLFRVLVKGHNKNNQSPSKTATSIDNAALPPKLIDEIQDEVQVAQAVRQVTSSDSEIIKDRFFLAGEYFPVTQRQMKQSWRYLRRMVREGVATELDVEATVNQIGSQGILLEPVIVPRRVNRTELLLLIDRDGSMVPFHSLSHRLVETASRGGRLGKAGIYYFHNCLGEYLYHDPNHQEAELVQDVLSRLRPDRTAVLIFSDAGAARGGFSEERIAFTEEFLKQLKQRVRYIAWLNPMPRSRWSNTTAGEINKFIPMFEVTRQGLESAIYVLRGQHQHSEELLKKVK
ncbi:hypothetical protein [Floridanema evergladense]|uniref:VWA containing CoxE family protein n=1 Tax=Floridaenema evergladense BLCC-F167 TaxID=3153639 RepID=A0ABV4WRS9_9CYAN